MFASRYFNPRYWSGKFWPKVGGEVVETPFTFVYVASVIINKNGANSGINDDLTYQGSIIDDKVQSSSLINDSLTYQGSLITETLTGTASKI
tara:strand:- start:284 stop:559 length:276 start_codon:yes stop_codon:yes gene_type:complete